MIPILTGALTGKEVEAYAKEKGVRIYKYYDPQLKSKRPLPTLLPKISSNLRALRGAQAL